MKQARYHKQGSLQVCLVMLGLILTAVACEESANEQGSSSGSPTSSGTQSEDRNPDAGNVLDYEVVEREDVSFGDAIRIVYRIGVPSAADENQLRLISEEVIEQEKEVGPVNAIGFFFYLPGTNTRGTYTAGKADWAPHGNWDEADSVESGDYSDHELVVEAGGLLDPFEPSADTAAIPETTRRQIFWDLVVEQDRGNDDGAHQTVASKYGVAVDAVEEIQLEGVTKGWPIPTAP